eukprot:1148079-Pelagomonas_calceolata.AAC.3
MLVIALVATAEKDKAEEKYDDDGDDDDGDGDDDVPLGWVASCSAWLTSASPAAHPSLLKGNSFT